MSIVYMKLIAMSSVSISCKFYWVHILVFHESYLLYFVLPDDSSDGPKHVEKNVINLWLRTLIYDSKCIFVLVWIIV
jgi:hypothetical protein